MTCFHVQILCVIEYNYCQVTLLLTPYKLMVIRHLCYIVGRLSNRPHSNGNICPFDW